MERRTIAGNWDLEEKFLSTLVLKFLDFTNSFEVHTNASDFTIRRVLILMQEGHLIAFESKKLFKAQLQWLIHLKSCI